MLAYAGVAAFLMVFGHAVRDFFALDQSLAKYVDACWEEAEPRSWASDALASVQMGCPYYKGAIGALMELSGRLGPSRASSTCPSFYA